MDPPDYTFEPLGLVNSANEIVFDSLYALQTPNTIYIEAEGGAVTPIGAPPFLSRDHIKPMEGNMYLVAKTEEGLIRIFDQNHEIEREIRLNIQERAVSASDLNLEMQNLPEQVKNKLKEKASDIKPDFFDIWASKDFFLLHTDNDEQSKEMVLLSRNGDPIGKFFLSDFDEIYSLKNQNVYTLHKDPEAGHSIRVYEFDLPEN